MNAFLTAATFIVLIAAAAYPIHRLNTEHADRIAVHRSSTPLPRRRGRGTPNPAGPRVSLPRQGPVAVAAQDVRPGPHRPPP